MPATVGLSERREPPGEWPDPTPQAEGSAAPQAVTESTEFAPVAQLGEHGKSRRMRRPVRTPRASGRVAGPDAEGAGERCPAGSDRIDRVCARSSAG